MATPAVRAVDRAGQVAPPRRRRRARGRCSGAVVEQQAGVDPVARAPQGEPAVAAPGRERRAVEAHRGGGHERGVEVDGVGARRRSARGRARGAPRWRRSRGRAGSTASAPCTRTRPVAADLHLGRSVVAEHAVGRHLLPEVVLVDELDREPEPVVPRVVVGRVAGRAPRPRACAPGGGGGACGPPTGRSRGRRPATASSVWSTSVRCRSRCPASSHRVVGGERQLHLAARAGRHVHRRHHLEQGTGVGQRHGRRAAPRPGPRRSARTGRRSPRRSSTGRASASASTALVARAPR